MKNSSSSYDVMKSLDLIQVRILNIQEAMSDFDLNKVPEKYFYDSIKLNLIEIGEESKLVNDFLKLREGSWDDIISKSYNLRISLTHYYKSILNKKISKYLKSDFELFIKKIESLKKEYGGN